MKLRSCIGALVILYIAFLSLLPLENMLPWAEGGFVVFAVGVSLMGISSRR